MVADLELEPLQSDVMLLFSALTQSVDGRGPQNTDLSKVPSTQKLQLKS